MRGNSTLQNKTGRHHNKKKKRRKTSPKHLPASCWTPRDTHTNAAFRPDPPRHTAKQQLSGNAEALHRPGRRARRDYFLSVSPSPPHPPTHHGPPKTLPAYRVWCMVHGARVPRPEGEAQAARASRRTHKTHVAWMNHGTKNQLAGVYPTERSGESSARRPAILSLPPSGVRVDCLGAVPPRSSFGRRGRSRATRQPKRKMGLHPPPPRPPQLTRAISPLQDTLQHLNTSKSSYSAAYKH